VGVLDMLRYHHFTGAAAWVGEYGCAEDAQQFRFLHAYSPVHNVRQDREYPAVLVVTGANDDRVPPGVHSYKFAAALQAAQCSPKPVLLRVQPNAGHGQGKAVAVQVAERADVLSFLFDQVGMR
jgi:prolyl oligopeptidase